MASISVTRLSYDLARKGAVNSPGINAASKKAVEDLLLQDAEKHHCYFVPAGLHNHLSHHLLAAYDLGATASHLKKIYDFDAPTQRPIILEEKDRAITVSDDNWTQYLGNQHAYGAFYKYYGKKVAVLGQAKALEQLVFDHPVNEKGKDMLIRVMSGALHPFIQIGYGVEFGNDTLVATGLAMAAIHSPTASQLYDLSFTDSSTNGPGLTILEILRKVYDSEVLHPDMPYDPDAPLGAHFKQVLTPGRIAEIRKICTNFHIDTKATSAEFAVKTEELVWAATLLTAATGRRGKKPRVDFFLMHLLTSSVFLDPFIQILENPIHKANLLRSYLAVVVFLTLARGRPRIDPGLLMGYTETPRPPTKTSLDPSKSALGSPLEDADYNPWHSVLQDIVHHPDSHVLKAVRALASGATKYGTTPAGGVVGAFVDGKELHPGAGSMDGTVFVRAAGLITDYMGWVANGQEERGDWDRSGLGWDAAWDKDVD